LDREDREEEGFADRWSRRKAAARSEAEESAAPTDEVASEEAEEEEPLPELPPVEELDAESDYTPFLDRRVPKELRKMALRKLWVSDPVLANLDGLNDYDENFRTMGLGKVVRTAYEVGRGMVTKAEKAAELAAAKEAEAAKKATDPADLEATEGEPLGPDLAETEDDTSPVETDQT
jgi:hypothetical protein